MLGLGWGEFLVLLTVAVVVVKPQHLPQVMQGLGQAVAHMRRLQNHLRSILSQASSQTSQVKHALGEEVAELKKDAAAALCAAELKESEPQLHVARGDGVPTAPLHQPPLSSPSSSSLSPALPDDPSDGAASS